MFDLVTVSSREVAWNMARPQSAIRLSSMSLRPAGKTTFHEAHLEA